ncbi:hypothetical protein BDZ91DRAFT_241550 [Kalaharituber pfeilii]|nr:hypothetical protein BDZ91DRAFT_241550 [Kalaharituber pfeilii]
MQVHPPRSHAFSGSSLSSTSTSSSSPMTSYSSPHTSIPSLTSRKIKSRLRGGLASYTHSDPPIDEGFFSTTSSPFIAPSSAMTSTTTATASPTFSAPTLKEREKGSPLHHLHAGQAKAKIKPLWKLATGNARASGNSLDLSQPGGGEAARSLGLGIYGEDDYMYDTYDEMDSFPRHHRKVSGTSGSGFSPSICSGAGVYTRSGQYIHPRRQVPRPYTPNQSCQGSDGHDSSDDEVDEFGSRGMHSGEYSRGNSIDYGSRRIPPLRVRTDSSFTSPMMRTTTTASGLNTSPGISPIAPMTTTHTSSGGLLRSSVRTHAVSGSTTRETSPSFQVRVMAAREEWEAKEAIKEEKREKKRRKSAQREREKAESRASKDIQRSTATVSWDETQGEKVEYPYMGYSTSGPESKWGNRSAQQQEWAQGKRKGVGLKKRWLGFVVWLRIGLVKMGRKFSGMKGIGGRTS